MSRASHYCRCLHKILICSLARNCGSIIATFAMDHFRNFDLSSEHSVVAMFVSILKDFFIIFANLTSNWIYLDMILTFSVACCVSGLNGMARSGGDASVDRRKRNYKLVLDPTLKPGSQKVYRFDGSLPGVIVTNCVG